MDIDTLRIYPIRLPFSSEFSHAARQRLAVNNVVVEISAEGGLVRGYGEAAPRSYVTGESQAGVVDGIRKLVNEGPFPWRLTRESQIGAYVDALPQRREIHSAVCALETALLDAWCRYRGKPLLDCFPDGHRRESVRYGAVLPLAPRERIVRLSRFAREMGIHCVKVKVGGDLQENAAMLEAIQEVYGGRAEILIDVNMAWDRDTALDHVTVIADAGVRVVEQPLRPGHPDAAALCALLAGRGLQVMADESVCTLAEADREFDSGHFTMMHVRLSKCGGLRRSLHMIGHLRRKRIPFAVGCQLGESGILSAAGRVLSLLCNDAAYYHCCYDEFLLQENTTLKDVSFGMEGAAGRLEGPGLGVQVVPERLVRLSEGWETPVLSRPGNSRTGEGGWLN